MRLKDILSPLAVDAFLGRCWERNSVHVCGPADKFAGVFSRKRFDEAVVRALRAPSPAFRVAAFAEDFEGLWNTTEAISPEDVHTTVQKGATVCVNDISCGDADLAHMCEHAKADLGFQGMVRCNSYLSPDRSGADMHFDRSASIVMQIEGEKTWQCARHAAVRWPVSNAKVERDGARVWSNPAVDSIHTVFLRPLSEHEFEHVRLTAGDVLFLPAGTWHAARAVGHSLALNLAFVPTAFEAAIRFEE